MSKTAVSAFVWWQLPFRVLNIKDMSPRSLDEMLSITTYHGAEREEDEGSAEKAIVVEEGAATVTSDGTGTQAADVCPLTQSGAWSGEGGFQEAATFQGFKNLRHLCGEEETSDKWCGDGDTDPLQWNDHGESKKSWVENFLSALMLF